MHQPCRGILVCHQAAIQEDDWHQVGACAVVSGQAHVAWALRPDVVHGVRQHAASHSWTLPAAVTSSLPSSCLQKPVLFRTTHILLKKRMYVSVACARFLWLFAWCVSLLLSLCCFVAYFSLLTACFRLVTRQCSLHCQFTSNNRSFSGPPSSLKKRTHVRVGCMCTCIASVLLINRITGLPHRRITTGSACRKPVTAAADRSAGAWWQPVRPLTGAATGRRSVRSPVLINSWIVCW